MNETIVLCARYFTGFKHESIDSYNSNYKYFISKQKIPNNSHLVLLIFLLKVLLPIFYPFVVIVKCDFDGLVGFIGDFCHENPAYNFIVLVVIIILGYLISVILSIIIFIYSIKIKFILNIKESDEYFIFYKIKK